MRYRVQPKTGAGNARVPEEMPAPHKPDVIGKIALLNFLTKKVPHEKTVNNPDGTGAVRFNFEL
jgi:hypothetical protein